MATAGQKRRAEEAAARKVALVNLMKDMIRHGGVIGAIGRELLQEINDEPYIPRMVINHMEGIVADVNSIGKAVEDLLLGSRNYS